MSELESIILGLDPSSTCCGWAVVDAGGSLIEAGRITPDARSAPSFERDMEICDDAESLLERFRPATVLIEWTAGKVGRRHGGFGAGLAVYGTGVGAVGRQCWLWMRGRPGGSVVPVLENEWTRRVPKATRSAAIESVYPALAGVADPGGDIHDAVGLIEWWRRRQLVAM